MRKVELSTHELEQEKSKLNERIEEEQISNSRDRKNLEEEWKTKLEKEKQGWKRKDGKRKNGKKQSWKRKNGNTIWN